MTKYCPISNIMAQEKDSNGFNNFWHCFLPLDRSVSGPVAGLLHIFTQWQNQIVGWKILACFGSHANEVRHHTASRTTTQARQSIEYTQMPQMYKIYWWYNILTAFFERWLSGIPPLHYRSFLKEDGPADKIYGNLVPPPNETRSDLIAWQLPTTKILDRQWEIKRSRWKDCLFGLAAFASASLESWTGLVWSQVTRALVERLTNMIIRLFTEFTCPVVLEGYYAQIDYPLLLISCIVLPVEVPWSREATMVVF
jgi:hypothetical protein